MKDRTSPEPPLLGLLHNLEFPTKHGTWPERTPCRQEKHHVMSFLSTWSANAKQGKMDSLFSLASHSGQVPCFMGNSKLCKRPSKGGLGEVRSFVGVSWLCKRVSKHRNAKRKQNHLFRGGFAFFLHFGQFSSCRVRQRGRRRAETLAGFSVIAFAVPLAVQEGE